MSVISKLSRGFLFSIVFAQMVFAVGPSVITADEKAEIVVRVASIMAEKYVDAEVGRKMANFILSRESVGKYNGYKDVESFCSALTSDLRSVSNDKHLFVFHSPEEKREVAARLNLLTEGETEEIKRSAYEADKRENFGFQKVEILDGNIGYINLRYFSGAEERTEIAIAVMAFLSNADAIVIDLRENGGGEGGSILSSYFFPPGKIELSGAYFRESDLVERSWTFPYVPGKRLPLVDLYILTSSKTFSAAEDFTYTLQQLKRAIVVGERTKGGAHPVDVIIVKDDILTQVSIGRSINPITKTNWEGVGVRPDINTPANDALSTAHLLALKGLQNKTMNGHRSAELRNLIQTLEKVENSQ
jgi:C-terminal processing protease CtpA/Prc